MGCMKVLRSDLLAGFKNKLFELDVENIDNLGINLENHKLYCNFSSKIVKNGFKLEGYVINNAVYDCDRCLESFSNSEKINTELLISHNHSNIKENSYDIIIFSDKDNSVDLSKTLIEILIAEKPLKNLCSTLCRGLCSICGINFNHKICSCNN